MMGVLWKTKPLTFSFGPVTSPFWALVSHLEKRAKDYSMFLLYGNANLKHSKTEVGSQNDIGLKS